MLCRVHLRWLSAHKERWEVLRPLSTPVLAAVSQSCSPGYSHTFYRDSRFYFIKVIIFWTRTAWQVAVVFVAKVNWASTCAAGLFLHEGLLSFALVIFELVFFLAWQG